MRQSSLRWGLIMGAAAAAVGLVAQLLGVRFNAASRADFNTNVTAILIFDIAVLVALGVALGLAYYTGIRVERERPPTPLAEIDPLRWGGERRDAALAGAIVMACFWFVTTFAAVLLGQYESGSGGLADYLTRRVIALVLFVVGGFGLGAWGARAPAARNLLDQIAAPSGEPRADDDRSPAGATAVVESAPEPESNA